MHCFESLPFKIIAYSTALKELESGSCDFIRLVNVIKSLYLYIYKYINV